MDNFEFYAPTRMIFGKDMVLKRYWYILAETARRNPDFWIRCFRRWTRRGLPM